MAFQLLEFDGARPSGTAEVVHVRDGVTQLTAHVHDKGSHYVPWKRMHSSAP